MGLQEQNCKILQLSDCTMMYILTYLDATALFNLSRTCNYFKNIVEDPKLWHYIEARNEPNSTKKVQYVCDRIHDRTTHILMRAESKYDGCVPQDTLLGWNQLQYLTVLALENQNFNGRTINLQNFPKTLEELSLKKTRVKNAKLFFHGSYMTMRHLRVLILDQCDWLDSNFFISVAKYESLEILSIIKCMRLHLNVIPYLSIAKHACKKLKIIDCRFNTISNEVLMQACKSVLALYFQSMSSYELDTGHRLMTIPHLTIEYKDLVYQSTIKNQSLDQFKYLTGMNVHELPQSLLYEDPYPECNCGWKDKNENDKENNEKDQNWSIDDYIDFNMSPQRFICRKHVRELNKLPKDFKNFFYHNQRKFYPEDSCSDNDSDSEEDDRECCMFGVGKSQQMIVLKVREADEQGNLPQPEVINILDPNQLINIDVNINEGSVQLRPCSPEPQPGPSTSRALDTPGTSRQTTKRKLEEEPGCSGSSSGSGKKKAKIETHTEGASSSASNSRSPDPKKQNSPPPMHEGNIRRRLRRLDDEAGPSQRYLVKVNHRRSDVRRFDNVLEHIRHKFGEGNAQDFNKSKLRRLSLRGYRAITDEALVCLRALSLDLLDVTYTKVTKDGIEKFLTLNPNCRVLHPDYCICKPRIPC